MGVVLSCDRVGCNATESAEGFHSRPGGPDNDAVIGLPEGWAVDRNGLDEVMHCPDHADEEG